MNCIGMTDVNATHPHSSMTDIAPKEDKNHVKFCHWKNFSYIPGKDMSI